MVDAMAEAYQFQRFFGAHRPMGDLSDQCNVLARREARNQIIELENKPDMLTAVERQLLGGERGHFAIMKMQRAVCREIKAAQNIQEGRFAATGRAQQDDEFPHGHGQVDAAQCMYRSLAGVVNFCQPARRKKPRASSHFPIR